MARFKAYITRHALTKGIFTIDAEDCFDISPKMIADRTGRTGAVYYHGGDWHRTFEDAVIKAKAMVERKIRGLKAQIVKLENLQFDNIASDED